MKYFFLAVFIALLFAGCDSTSTAPGTYPTPKVMGTGTLIEFYAKNSFGNNVFHAALGKYLEEHKDYRLVSILEIEHDDQVPKKYLCVFELLPGAVPPPQPAPPDPAKFGVEAK